MKTNIAYVLAALQFCLQSVFSLECYVCTDQDGNVDKCLRTIKTCEYEETRCLSTIRWSTTPYWTEGAEYQYYVSKRCATEETCMREIEKSMPICHYIWYEDWKCAECCLGDRCNYYVTLGASTSGGSMVLLAATLAVTLFTYSR